MYSMSEYYPSLRGLPMRNMIKDILNSMNYLNFIVHNDERVRVTTMHSISSEFITSDYPFASEHTRVS